MTIEHETAARALGYRQEQVFYYSRPCTHCSMARATRNRVPWLIGNVTDLANYHRNGQGTTITSSS